MYGKLFAQMYTGSMFGKPAIVFAVWGFIISNMRPARDGECYCEINPVVLAATFATTMKAIDGALLILESPDSNSRCNRDDGRRIVLIDEDRRLGPRQYRVVNGARYRAIRDDEDRREQNRRAKRRQRGRTLDGESSAAVSQCQPPATQAEEEVDEEEEATPPLAGVTDHDNIRRVVTLMTPKVLLTDADLTEWLQEFRDPAWIAASLCEEELSLRKARSVRFLTSILRRKHAEGLTIEDPRGYVEYRLSALTLAGADAAHTTKGDES